MSTDLGTFFPGPYAVAPALVLPLWRLYKDAVGQGVAGFSESESHHSKIPCERPR